MFLLNTRKVYYICLPNCFDLRTQPLSEHQLAIYLGTYVRDSERSIFVEGLDVLGGVSDHSTHLINIRALTAGRRCSIITKAFQSQGLGADKQVKLTVC